MKKRYFILALILPLMFCGCLFDANNEVKRIYGASLAVDGVQDLEFKLYIKSAKLIPDAIEECKLITADRRLKYFKSLNIPRDNENFKAFDVPAFGVIKDRIDVNIKFIAITEDHEFYEGELNIPLLQHAYSKPNTEPVVLRSKDNEMTAVFSYYFELEKF